MSRDTLIDKLHPRRVTSSAKMHFIMGRLLGEQWATHERDNGAGFSITSDGHVVTGGLYIGTAAEFRANVEGYLAAAELTPEEAAEFWRLYGAMVDDWRGRV